MSDLSVGKTSWKLSWIEAASVIGGGFFLLLCKGVEYLTHNQAMYFLSGLRQADSTFIPRDWFTWQTFHHDFAFSYLIALLSKLGPLSATTLAAEIVLLIVFSYSIFILCRKFSSRPMIVYSLLIGWLGVISANEMGLGWQYLFHGFLQPSEVAGCLMVVGMILLLDHRFLLSGIVLGVAGLVHGAYLSSFGPAIVITALAVGILRSKRWMLSFGIPLALLWGLLVFVVFRAFAHSTPPTQETMSLMTHLRAPNDFMVATWPLDWTLNWFVWALLGVFVMFGLPGDQKYKELRICFFALLFTSLAGIVQALLINHQSLTLLMLWRSSPMVLILGMAVVLDRVVHVLMNPERIKKEDKIFFGLLMIAAVILLNNQWGVESNRRFLWIMTFPLAALGGWLTGFWKKDRAMVGKVIAVILVGFMVMIMVRTSYRGIVTSRNFETHPEPASLGEVEQWAQKNTPSESIFVVAPDMEYMRIRGRRAVVVDWSSACYLPTNLLEWYHRLCEISGVAPEPMVKNETVFAEGYRRLDLERAKRLKNLYGAEYVVVSAKNHVGDLKGLRETFVNADYRVLAIP